MWKVYYELATGTIIKIIQTVKNTTMDEDMKSHSELAAYNKDDISFIKPKVDNIKAMRVNPYTEKVELTPNALIEEIFKVPFKIWAGTSTTNSSGVATISIPEGTFTKIDQVFAVAEANVIKAEETPHVAIKNYNLTSVTANVTRYRTISGILGLIPTGEFVGQGVRVNFLVLGK